MLSYRNSPLRRKLVWSTEATGRVAGTSPHPARQLQGDVPAGLPLGVREADYVTIFPAGITAGASFDRALIRQRGLYMAEEFRAKEINIALS